MKGAVYRANEPIRKDATEILKTMFWILVTILALGIAGLFIALCNYWVVFK